MTGRLAAAIVLVLGAGPAVSADLGRMFFTPTQRATLDNARKQNIRIEIGSDNVERERPQPVAQNISVNGVVQRSDGKSTVWLNNRAVSDRQAGGINVSATKNDNHVKLTVPDSGRTVDLKVGQTVEIVSGTIEESYKRRATLKPEAKATPGAENTAAAEKSASSQTTLPSRSAEAALKRELRNKELDTLYDLQRLNSAQSK